jgi:hypothetical protein
MVDLEHRDFKNIMKFIMKGVELLVGSPEGTEIQGLTSGALNVLVRNRLKGSLVSFMLWAIS